MWYDVFALLFILIVFVSETFLIGSELVYTKDYLDRLAFLFLWIAISSILVVFFYKVGILFLERPECLGLKGLMLGVHKILLNSFSVVIHTTRL